MTSDDYLRKLAQAHIDGRMAHKILRFGEMNPEQKLAYVLELLVQQKKETLALMQVTQALAEEVKVWKDTPEGQAWRAKMAAKREAALTKTLRKDVVQQLRAED